MSEPEKKKRKSPQGAACQVCGGRIKRGKSMCVECYDKAEEIIGEQKTLLIRVTENLTAATEENEKLVKEKAKLTTEKALRDSVLSSSFHFTVYQEAPKPSRLHVDGWEGEASVVGLATEPRGAKTVLEISDGGVVRLKAYIPEGVRISNLVGLTVSADRLLSREKKEKPE